jgi:hypothetical protein
MGKGVTPWPNQENKKLKVIYGRAGKNRTYDLFMVEMKRSAC